MTNETQQTAVELLFNKLWDTPKDKFTWNAILEEHMKIEKEQIIEALLFGDVLSLNTAETYYKETYGGNI